jgi:hypothetical protein
MVDDAPSIINKIISFGKQGNNSAKALGIATS